MAEIIDNVTFLYTKIQKPVKKYQSDTDTEWTVDCVVSKAAAKAWKKAFPKNKVKEFDNDEFTEKFEIDRPFPEQDELFIIKLKKDCVKGEWVTPEKYRPRVILQQDGSRVDVTFDKLVGNGSKGKVSYTIRDVKDEQFPQLSAILVESLVEYEGASSGGAGEEFGASQAAVPEGNDKTPVVKQGESKPATKANKKAKEEESDEDVDVPF